MRSTVDILQSWVAVTNWTSDHHSDWKSLLISQRPLTFLNVCSSADHFCTWLHWNCTPLIRSIRCVNSPAHLESHCLEGEEQGRKSSFTVYVNIWLFFFFYFHSFILQPLDHLPKQILTPLWCEGKRKVRVISFWPSTWKCRILQQHIKYLFMYFSPGSSWQGRPQLPANVSAFGPGLEPSKPAAYMYVNVYLCVYIFI